MKAIDMHSHLPGKAFYYGRKPTPDFLYTMDKSGIDTAVVFTIDGFFYDPIQSNNLLNEQVKEANGRLIPFCTVDPRNEMAHLEIRRCICELGFKGIKIHPWWQGVSPLDPCMKMVAEEAVRLKVPIIFHDGTPPFSSPLQIAYLAGEYPDLKVILGHGGGMDLWIEAVAAVKRYPNCTICLCGSATPPAILRLMIEELGADKVTIGTDAGFGDDYYVKYRMEQFHDLLKDFPLIDQERMYWQNAVELLNI